MSSVYFVMIFLNLDVLFIALQKMAWGHMPFFLVKNELKSGELISLEGNYIKSSTLDIVIARLQNISHGPVTRHLWKKLTNVCF